ncbi:MAG: dihydroorotate dehydrogenase electron transfer subunit, partial [Myxococcota bacterium]
MHQRAEVKRQQRLGRDAWLLRLALPAFAPPAPGQFVMLRVTEGGDPLLGRAMAIYRSSRRGRGATVDVVYRVVGRGTALLAAAAPGRKLWVLGPLGGAFRLPPAGGRAVLVGGGTGIASLHLLGQALRRRRVIERVALIGARTKTELLCRQDFRALGARVRVSTDDGTAGLRGTVTDLLEKTLGGAVRPPDAAYVCGPTPMMESAWRVCERAGIPCQVSLEGPMACGFGVCLGCAVPCRVADPSAPVLSPRDHMKLICTD